MPISNKYSKIFHYTKIGPKLLFSGYSAKERAISEWAHVFKENVIEEASCFDNNDLWSEVESLKEDKVELRSIRGH